MALVIWTVGHSNRSADDFLALLRAHDIELIADVRRFPVSRRHPHFTREQLERVLADAGIDYHWMPALGGRRSPRAGSVNTGWRVEGFRGYADYMETPEFADALTELLDVAFAKRTAVMCAEALWWQCHRRLISDVLFVLGHEIRHIQTVTAAPEHKLVPPAHSVGGRLSYAAEQPDLL